MANGSGDFFTTLTHMAAALLGGSVTEIIRALSSKQQRDMEHIQRLCDQLQEERNVTHGRYRECQELLQAEALKVMDCQQGMLQLLRQLIINGIEPTYKPEWADGVWLEKASHHHRRIHDFAVDVADRKVPEDDGEDER